MIIKHSKIFLLVFCVLFLSACNYVSNNLSPTPSNTIAPPEFTSTEPPPTTQAETPSPPLATITETPTLTLNDLGIIVNIFDNQYIVPFQSFPISTLLGSQVNLSSEDIHMLVEKYSSIYDVEGIQEGRFYRLPEFDEEGNMKKGEDKPLEVRLGNYDRTETIKGMGEFPVYELGMNESIADILILPLDNPEDQDGYSFDIRRFNFNTGNVGGVYIDRENELMNAPRNPLTIGALGYDSMEDFKNVSEEEILNQIRLSNAWNIDISAYGWTNLALVFRDDGEKEIVPFIIDKEVQPTPKTGGGNGGVDPTSTPWIPPEPTDDPHG